MPNSSTFDRHFDPVAAIPKLSVSKHFTTWLFEQQLSIAFTADLGQLVLLGLDEAGQLSGFQREFGPATTLSVADQSLYLQANTTLWRLDNMLQAGQRHQQYDALYMPQAGYAVGNLTIADLQKIAAGSQSGSPTAEQFLFANTTYNCISSLDGQAGVTPVWNPSFISEIVPENRCHLSGVAMEGGVPQYVTAAGCSDQLHGWRHTAPHSGVLIDVPSNEVILNGLSLPHAPRAYLDHVWLLNSGRGEFGHVDVERGKFNPIAFAPGFLRGLAFHRQFAVMGLAKLSNALPSDLSLSQRLNKLNRQAECGLMVVDLTSGQIVHWLRLEGDVREIYDVQLLPKVRCPMVLGLKNDEVRQFLFALETLGNGVGLSPPDPPKGGEKSEVPPFGGLGGTPSPRVSVIIPAYNAADFIGQALESVLAQTYDDYEIIVVDDGSTDETQAVVEPYRDNIRYHYQENQGVSLARNQGLALARGELIAWLDSDDFFYPDKLAKQVAIFDQQPFVGMVHSGWNMVNEKGQVFAEQTLWEHFSILDIEAWLVHGIVLPSAMMFRRPWLEEVGGFDSRFDPAEDVDLTARLALRGCQGAWLKEITVGYRHHPHNATRNTLRQAESFEAMYTHFFTQPDLPDYVQVLEPLTRYRAGLWAAFRLYQTGHLAEMGAYFEKSLAYSPFPQDEIMERWLDFFIDMSSQYNLKFDLAHLTQSSVWERLQSRIQALST